MWEDLLGLNCLDDSELEVLPPAISFSKEETFNQDVFDALKRDKYNLPTVSGRELCSPHSHLHYWLSGYNDYLDVLNFWRKYKGFTKLSNILELGCSTGRVLRHFAIQNNVNCIGCDINYKSIRWSIDNLPQSIKFFQNTNVPHLPIEDSSLDCVTAFSIFTHIEAFDTGWISEINRVLKPGGLAYITIHSGNTLKTLTPGNLLYHYISEDKNFSHEILSKDIAGDRLVFRKINTRAYCAHVFYNINYIKKSWGRIMNLEEVLIRSPQSQDLIIFTKEN